MVRSGPSVSDSHRITRLDTAIENTGGGPPTDHLQLLEGDIENFAEVDPFDLAIAVLADL